MQGSTNRFYPSDAAVDASNLPQKNKIRSFAWCVRSLILSRKKWRRSLLNVSTLE